MPEAIEIPFAFRTRVGNRCHSIPNSHTMKSFLMSIFITSSTNYYV